MNKRTKILIGIVSLVVILIVAFAGVAFAAGPEGSSDITQSRWGGLDRAGGCDGDCEDECDGDCECNCGERSLGSRGKFGNAIEGNFNEECDGDCEGNCGEGTGRGYGRLLRINGGCPDCAGEENNNILTQ